MSFKCFNCRRSIDGVSFKVPAEANMPIETVLIDGVDKHTTLQFIVNLCKACSASFRVVTTNTRMQER